MPLCKCGSVYTSDAVACDECLISGVEDAGVTSDEYECAYCGCTDDDACEGGCEWIAPNVCSNCADQVAEA